MEISEQTEDTPGIGHNIPNPVETLNAELSQDNIPLLRRRDDLLAACERMPTEVDDDEMAGKFSDQIKQLKDCAKDAETRRVGDKAPHLALAQTVDGFYKAISEPMKKAAAGALATLGTYQREKEARERQRREAEAERAAREALAAAAKVEDEETLDQAVEAEVLLQKAEDAAAANAADMSRTRGDFGAVASLRTTWDFEIIDINEVPVGYMSLNQQAVRAAIKGKDGARHIPGLRIYERKNAVVR